MDSLDIIDARLNALRISPPQAADRDYFTEQIALQISAIASFHCQLGIGMVANRAPKLFDSGYIKKLLDAANNPRLEHVIKDGMYRFLAVVIARMPALASAEILQRFLDSAADAQSSVQVRRSSFEILIVAAQQEPVPEFFIQNDASVKACLSAVKKNMPDRIKHAASELRRVLSR